MRPRKLDRCVSGMACRVYAGDDNCSRKRADEAIDKRSGKTGKLLSTLPADVKMKKPAVRDSCLQHLDPSAKIKLQLFPLDEDTRMRLEKGGHNPHLELILKARKKIFSVLKHIDAKWGCSIDTGGGPVLFPYRAEERGDGSPKWTLEDNEVTAGEVYATIGYPAIFRLRYGWLPVPAENQVRELSNSPSIQCLHSSSLAEEPFQRYEVAETNFSDNHSSMPSQREKARMTNEDDRLAVEMITQPQPSMEQLGQAETTLGGAKQLAAWCDNLTSISIGGLFSEASLQGRPSNFKINGTGVEPSVPPSQSTLNSFDALLCGFQTQTMPSNDTCLSIFDAEDTCMAFPFRSSSSKKTGEVTANGCLKPSNQVKLSEGFPNQGSSLQLCSVLNNGESSLGLSGINWTNTLGPFDLGLPSRKVVTEDSNDTGQRYR